MKDLLITDASQAASAPVGGKAANLFRLAGMGFHVPRFAVIPARAAWPGEADLLEALRVVFGSDPAARFAVRSSAIGEDGKELSHAGLYETFLFVPLSDVPARVDAVRASAASERVQAYRREAGLVGEDPGVGVVVQEMVDADRSGVAFGADAVNGDPTTKIIAAVFGLGEGLVSGDLDADTWHVRARGVEARIVRKERRIVRDASGSGTIAVEVAEAQRDMPALSGNDIATVTATLDRLSEEFGGPQDIEFAFVGERFFLLQSRPITAAFGEYTVWDNSNIIESYPGVSSPLTFSFILKMYEAVYVQFCDLLGVDGRTIARNRDVFANTLGHVRGRVYYNLLNWYKMLAMVPGYSINARFMETMMGVKERFELKEEYRMTKATAWWRILKMLLRMIRLHGRLPKERARFQRHLDATMARYEAIDFSALPAAGIIEHYKDFERTLLKEWKAPLINDFFAMIWFGVLQKLCARWVPDVPNLHNDLLCGSRDIISTGPIHACMAIARAVNADPAARMMFVDHQPEAIRSMLKEARAPRVQQMVDDYLKRFGERCVGELKLETVSYAQDPVRFINVLRSYVLNDITESNVRTDTDAGLRARAEEALNNGLRGRPMKRRILRYVLGRARDLVSARENLRFERTRGFGMVRKMCSAVGVRWAQEGHLADGRDVFLLDLSEVLDPKPELWPALIAARKKAMDRWMAAPAPSERFGTYGSNFNDAVIYSQEKITPVEGDLKGIGCCPGVVEGRVRKVLDPSTVGSLDGDILVTSSTDPGWVTLFPSCSAILVERGSLLSHSAIVSREMGIPCIVSVPGLLRTLGTGDLVRMDGSTGVIQLIEKRERASA